MEWGKVFYIFFTLMSLTTSAAFLYENSLVALFIAGSVNVVSTILKIGVRNILSAELLAGSLVADLHLIPAFFAMKFYENDTIAVGLVIGAVIANVYTIMVSMIESSKEKADF
ncbi:MAG: membrane protein [Epsilonproteobacteria bacterium (ex Lamellibrachia satsuma)]|nr:MAG: membrane protein [Epsilonproteobacteria bacterium (ex Lamellibrachia satsuma)]